MSVPVKMNSRCYELWKLKTISGTTATKSNASNLIEALRFIIHNGRFQFTNLLGLF